jgi:nucleoside phosphorylase/tetratricopeptide (TPR) repeat protein
MAAYEPWLEKPERSILLMMGLFDRPAEMGEIRALRKDPVVFGLTDGLKGVGTAPWNTAVARLRRIGLLADKQGQDERLDAHPLVREHFGEQLKEARAKAWKEGHQRLYEYLKGKAKTFPETIEEMAPLYAAVVHGCLAGRNQETLDVYKKRIQRLDETFSLKKLGAYGSVAAAISAFFVSPWDRLSPGLSEAEQAWVQHEAGFALRGLGRLPEATDLLRLSLESDLAREDWQSAAISACNLSELLQFRGELLEAQTAARESIVLADRDGAPFWCMTNRTVLAAILHALGRQDKAEALFGEAERMQMDHEPACPLLYSLRGYQYCNLLLDQARHVAVLARAAQTLKWVEFHGPLDIALNHVSIGRAHQFAARGSGRIDQNHACQAAKHLQQAVDGLRRANTLHHLPLGLLARAAFLIDTADLPAAHRDLDEALTLSQRCGFRLHECDAHLGFARYHLALRDPAEAAHHLSAASAIIDDTSYHRRDTELADLKAQARLMAEAISRQDRQAGRQERKENDSSAEPSEPSDPLRSSRTLAPLRETPASASTAPSPAPAPTPPPAPSPTMPTNPPVDFLIFAPLEEERDAVLSKLPEPRLLESDGTDSHVYFEAHLPTRRSDRAVYRILVTSPADMGPIHAATTAAHVAERWRPEHVIVVGIAGGLKDEVALGDVMVARSVADYTVGKVHEDGTREERWSMVPADAGLGNYAGAFSTGWEDLISLPRPRGTGTPTRHSGIVASGGDVIANKKLIDTYRKDMPKLIGVEMEGGGVATALHAHMARPRFLMIRGVSDLADAEGNAGTKKQWRAYARDVAAAYTVGMLRAGPVPARRQDASVHAAAPGSSEHLLDALNRLLPAELEVLVFKLALPAAILSASSAPQATRAVEILRWADRAGRLDEVARRLAEVSGK